MSDPPWYTQCLDNIAKLGGTLCPADFCYDAGDYLYHICNCVPPYSNGCPDPPTPDCCAYGPTSPIWVSGPDPCYCCCITSDSAVPVVSVEGEARPIGEIAVGDAVRAALDPGLKDWALVPARFSSGTGEGGPAMVLRFGDPHELETIVASPDQLFLVGGKLKPASRLQVGKDRLTRPDGGTVDLLAADEIPAGGPQHRIATSTGPEADWAGHLIVVNGVVCGDYALQLADLETARPDMLAR